MIYITNIRTFGVPYFELATRLDAKNILKSLFRLPESKKQRELVCLTPAIPPAKKEEVSEKDHKELTYICYELFLLFLSGCWDTNEPEQMVYAQGMG